MFMQTCSLTTYGVKLFAFGRLETSFITATATALCAHHVPHANSFHQFQFTFNSIAFDVKLHDIQLTERIRVCSVPIILLTHILTPDFYSVELQCAPFFGTISSWIDNSHWGPILERFRQSHIHYIISFVIEKIRHNLWEDFVWKPFIGLDTFTHSLLKYFKPIIFCIACTSQCTGIKEYWYFMKKPYEPHSSNESRFTLIGLLFDSAK